MTFLSKILKGDWKSLTIDMVREGILNEQKIWNPHVVFKDQKENSYRNNILMTQILAWKQIFLFMNITNEDIREIIVGKHSPSSDEARRKLLMVYSLETPLYQSLNQACQTRDHSKLKTLGPFALLLTYTIRSPPKVCWDNRKEHQKPVKWYKDDDIVKSKI